MIQIEEDWSRFLPPFDSELDHRMAARFSDRTVCVFGAAGDIGSALARALAGPARTAPLILFDSNEHGLFELRRHLKSPVCVSVLGNLCDEGAVDSALRSFNPEIIFHAAAYKHVGMLEQNPFAAIENNVRGTEMLIKSVSRHGGVSTLVLLSTDKAVNPHSVMGVSKRIAELMVLTHSSQSMRMSAIRLGNVIGSRGSVVPIFLDEIKNGQSLRVTDARATRYFLSRAHAVDSILHAAEARCDGVVLLPDLGSPVRVADLARFLLKTYDPQGNLKLCFTGLHPGEKLSEELIAVHEYSDGTVRGPLTIVKSPGLSKVESFACLPHRDQAALVSELQRLVPEYVPSELMQRNSF